MRVRHNYYEIYQQTPAARRRSLTLKLEKIFLTMYGENRILSDINCLFSAMIAK